jgi:hypothetical protein
MRPYIAIIRDSFREALASRVLWILFILTTLLLAAIAPLAMVEQRATEFSRSEIRDWPTLLAQLVADGSGNSATPGKRTWDLFDKDLQQEIRAVLEDESNRGVRLELVSKVLDALNQVLSKRDFYDEACWKEIDLDSTTRDLLAGLDSADKQDIALTNRLLLRAAFPVYLPTISTTQLFVTYLGRPVGSALPFTRSLADPVINEIVAAVMNFFVGTLGVFAAILVTASIIPNTFEAGAIDFLLSKPVSRVMLLLTKFLGGCAFILLIASYFIVGIWLVIGVRFQLWNHRILLTIPLFMFLFSIYFCVSTFAGVRWKNATVSIVISILFWASCFVVGLSKDVIEGVFLDPNKLVKLVPLEDSIIGVRRSGTLVEWLPAPRNEWEEILSDTLTASRRRSGLGSSVTGPIYDADKKQLLFIRQPAPSFARFRLRSSEPDLFLGRQHDASWDSARGVGLPYGTKWIFTDSKGRVVLLAAKGLFRASGELARSTPPIAGILNMLPFLGDQEVFDAVGPAQEMNLSMPFAAAMHPDSGDVYAWHQNRLTLLRYTEDDKYEQAAQIELPESEDVALACAGQVIACVLADGELFLLDAISLATLKRFRPAGQSTPYMAMASPDGLWLAVLFHSGRLLLYDIEQEHSTWVGSNVSAASFDGDDLLVADRVERITRYRTGSFEQETRCQPEMTTLHRVHHFFLSPFYRIFPKPGELSEVVDYLLTDKESRALGPPRIADLSQARDVIDLAGPIKNGAWFVVIMLALCCFYVTRKDF